MLVLHSAVRVSGHHNLTFTVLFSETRDNGPKPENLCAPR